MDVTTSPLLARSGKQTSDQLAPNLVDDDHYYYNDDDDDEEDTLSLRDLPLHSNDDNDDRSIINSPAHQQVEDLFEFSSEFLIKSNVGGQAVDRNSSTSNVVFCGKLISHGQVENKEAEVVDQKQKNEDHDNTTTSTASVNSKKKQSRVSRWKSFSMASSSSASASSSSSSCCSSRNGSIKSEDGSFDSEVVVLKKKKEIKKNGRSKGYKCMAIGVEWKFPVKSMDIQDIKVRQSRIYSNRSSFDYTTTNNDGFRSSDSSAATKSSAKGLWSLLGVLAGGGRPY